MINSTTETTNVAEHIEMGQYRREFMKASIAERNGVTSLVLSRFLPSSGAVACDDLYLSSVPGPLFPSFCRDGPTTSNQTKKATKKINWDGVVFVAPKL